MKFSLEGGRFWVSVGVIYALVLLVLFWPFVVSDLMLRGSDQLLGGVFFREIWTQYLRHGEFLQWQPYSFGGMPFIDAFHGDLFYPPSVVLRFLLPVHRALGWGMILHLWLGGMFMALAAREWLGCARWCVFLSGLGYALAPLFVSLVAPGHDGKMFVIAWFPLGMVLVKRLWDAFSLRRVVWLSLFVGMLMLTTHVQMIYFSLWAFALYSLYRAGCYIWLRFWSHIWKCVLGFALAVLLGIGVGCVQFLPGYLYTMGWSPRSTVERGYEYASSWSLHWNDVLGQVMPGVPGHGFLYSGPNPFKDNSEYVSVLLIVFALIALFRCRVYVSRWFFLGLGLFALAYALGAHTPIHRLCYEWVPLVDKTRAPSMIAFVWLFCVCLLAAMAMKSWVFSWRGGLIVTAFLVIDAGVRDRDFIELVSVRDLYFKHSVVSRLQLEPWVRVYVQSGVFPENYFAYHRIPQVLGYHGNQLRSYDSLVGGYTGERLKTWSDLANVGVTHVVFRVQQAPEASPQADVVASEGGVQLAKLRYSTGLLAVDSTSAVEDFRYRPGFIGFRISGPATGVVVRENYYVGWSAFVDGQTVSIERSGPFMRLFVPVGEHDVRLVYESKYFRKGVAFSLLSVLGILCLVGVSMIRTV